MGNPNRRLLQVLSVGWAGFLLLGLGLRYLVSGPTVVVVIDHSFCPEPERQRVLADYADLYQQHQQRQLRIQQVLLLSDLGQEQRSSPPTPEEMAELGFFGDAIATQLQQVSEQYPNAEVLTCSP